MLPLSRLPTLSFDTVDGASLDCRHCYVRVTLAPMRKVVCTSNLLGQVSPAHAMGEEGRRGGAGKERRERGQERVLHRCAHSPFVFSPSVSRSSLVQSGLSFLICVMPDLLHNQRLDPSNPESWGSYLRHTRYDWDAPLESTATFKS